MPLRPCSQMGGDKGGGSWVLLGELGHPRAVGNTIRYRYRVGSSEEGLQTMRGVAEWPGGEDER